MNLFIALCIFAGGYACHMAANEIKEAFKEQSGDMSR